MRRTFAMLALVGSMVATSAAAQTWTTEIGIQSGYTRIKPAGSGAPDHIDLFGGPGDLFGVFPTNPSLYAIFPWKSKLAIEPSASVYQGNSLFIGDATFVTLGLRGDYLVTPNFYAAVGGVVHWFESGGSGETQLGVQGALGYRFPFVAGLRGRVEASATFFGNSEQLSAANAYAVTLGVSKQIGTLGRAARAPARRATSRAWEPVFGIQGGYVRAHGVGGAGDLTSISFPGLGGAFSALGTPVGPPTLFAILPIGRKIAVEPGIDIHRLQTQGTTIFVGNVALRLNYAVSGGWYAALGGNVVYFKETVLGTETLTGMNLGWGYRFPLGSGLAGRFEVNYSLMGDNANLGPPPGIPAINTLALQFGVTMPLR